MPRDPILKSSIYSYLSYREFLRDRIKVLQKSKGFTMKSFCTRSGLGSTSYLSMIIKGSRNLTLKSVPKVCRGLNLSANETRYFDRLLKLELAESPIEKNLIYRSICELRKLDEGDDELLATYEYFSKWYMSVIFVALSTDWAKLGEEEMAATLGIKKSELLEALSFLKSLGLAAQDNRNIWRGKVVHLKTPKDVQDLNVRNFHRAMIEKALTSLDSISPEDRDIGSLTIAVDESDFQELRQKLRSFRSEMARLYSAKPARTKGVYQINFQLVPVLKW